MAQGRDYTRVVKAGNVAFNAIMEMDSRKSGVSTRELEHGLTAILSRFVTSCELSLTVAVKFTDVHALMGKHWHTELSYVQVEDRHCILNFHERLISFTDRSSGFVFVAKSWVLLLILAETLAQVNGLRTQFVFEIGDRASLDQVAFCSSSPRACLIPDDEFAASQGYADYRAVCERDAAPWHERQTKILWRGSTTGSRATLPPAADLPDDLTWLPRLAFCRLVAQLKLTDICDVGITNLVQINEPHLIERIKASGLIRPRVPRTAFLHVKGAFDLDGNSNAWSGLFCSLLGASCVLKIASPEGFRQWYYADLKPWVHYVPVQSDCADLKQAVQWFADHDHEASLIAARGREFAKAMDIKTAVQGSAEHLGQWLTERTIHGKVV